MKKIIVLTVTISVLCLYCFSQNARFGVNAGAVLASMKGKYQGQSENSDGKAGINVGVLAEVPVAETFCFMPFLNFLQKGGKFKESSSGYTFEGKHTLNYMELLLNMVYCSQAGNGKFFAGLGPGVSFGISGKYKDKTTFGGQTETEKGDIKFGNDENEDDYKPIDFGGNVLAGYEFSCGVFVALNYYLGFSNLVIDGDSDNSAKNRYFGIRVGYYLSKLAKK